MQYYLLTLGCPKNTVDSEGMAMLLSNAGYRGTATADDADVMIVNTCGFLEAAEEESLKALRELAAHKRRGQVLVAAGCMAQRNGERIIQEVPGVDGLLGTRRWMEVVPFIRGLRGGQSQRPFHRYALLGDPEQRAAGPFVRPPVTNGSAYLKISDGCNAPCAFCTIPSFKGKLRSRPSDAIVAEARALVADGSRELILIAQDTTDYGRDLDLPDALPALMRAILDATPVPTKDRAGPALHWLRLMYAYPGHISEALIAAMASDPRVCHYLDIPLQHGHPATLQRMFRPANIDRLVENFAKMRAAMPDMAFRSTFIVGYPGESEEEFLGLLDFVEMIQFDKVGVFTFSPEPGTLAFDMPNQVPAEVKNERYARVMALQQRISLMRNQAQVGRTLDVLVEAHGELDPPTAPATNPVKSRRRGKREQISLARSYRDAPEVDGLVVVSGTLPIGCMASVRVTGAMAYDLLAEPLHQQEPHPIDV